MPGDSTEWRRPVENGKVQLDKRLGVDEREIRRRLDPAQWPALPEEELTERLIDVKGIGRWTAEMFLMFHELRPDVFPVADIGLQKAVAHHYHDGNRLPPGEFRAFGLHWAPYRSVATWYLWRWLDPIPVEY